MLLYSFRSLFQTTNSTQEVAKNWKATNIIEKFTVLRAEWSSLLQFSKNYQGELLFKTSILSTILIKVWNHFNNKLCVRMLFLLWIRQERPQINLPLAAQKGPQQRSGFPNWVLEVEIGLWKPQILPTLSQKSLMYPIRRLSFFYLKSMFLENNTFSKEIFQFSH